MVLCACSYGVVCRSFKLAVLAVVSLWWSWLEQIVYICIVCDAGVSHTSHRTIGPTVLSVLPGFTLEGGVGV
jgi:hypothetical protein